MVELPHRTAQFQEPETPIPIIGCDSLKCPFNGKAGLVFFNARHGDSGAPRSIFAEKPGKPAFPPRSLQTQGRQKTPVQTQENAENGGKTTPEPEKCHGGR